MNDKRQQMPAFLQRASAIMNRADEIAPKVSSKAQPTMGESLMGESAGYGSYDDYGYQEDYSYQPQQRNSGTSKLPSVIANSIMENPIQEYEGMGSLSVLDGIMGPPQSKQQRQSRQMMNESYEYGEKQMPSTEELFNNRTQSKGYQQPAYQQPVYQQPPQNNVDYSVISSIIKTAVAEEIQKLSKTILTENKGKQGDVILSIDNGSIKFVSSNGKVYEGKLKLIGNLKG